MRAVLEAHTSDSANVVLRLGQQFCCDGAAQVPRPVLTGHGTKRPLLLAITVQLDGRGRCYPWKLCRS